jgi:hypothetical protein
MIPIKIKRGRFKRAERFYLPSDYTEMTLGQYLDHKRHTGSVGDLIAYLAKCPYKLDADQFVPFLVWLAEPLDVAIFKPDPDLFDIKRKTLGQKITAHNALKDDATMFGVEKVVKIYFPDSDPLNQPLSEVMPRYLAIVDQIEFILQVEKDRLDTTPTAEQIRAGVESFSELGYFNQIDDLAAALHLTYDAVLELEYIVAFQKLLRMKISTTFEKRYNEILREKK